MNTYVFSQNDAGQRNLKLALLSLAIAGAVVLTAAFSSGSTYAATESEENPTSVAVETIVANIGAVAAFDRMEQAPALYTSANLAANVAAFDQMEQAPALYTSANLAANVAAFDQMEQAPALYTIHSEPSGLTHPWGGDRLDLDY